MSDQKALDRYKSLIHQAETLERMATDSNVIAAGQTYWSNVNDCTRGAIASTDFTPSERVTFSLPEETIKAIHYVAPEHFDPIWKAAAAILRERARAMKGELEKQAAEVASALIALDQVSSG